MQRAYAVLTIKALDDEERIIEGIATTPNPDLADDVIEPLGVEFSLPMPLLFMHDKKAPVGEVFWAKAAKETGWEWYLRALLCRRRGEAGKAAEFARRADAWREAARNNGATTLQYWLHVALPVLAPSLLGGLVLLFGSAFAAYATAAAMVGSTVPLVTLQISDALSGNVLVGQENVALALSLDMVLIAGLVMAVYLPLQRRSARWLA